LLAVPASTNAPWALFQKATSTSSMLTLALAAAAAPVHARTMLSLRTKYELQPLHEMKKSLFLQAFFVFFGKKTNFGKRFDIFATFFLNKNSNNINSLLT
jgi:hypothetical protein